MASFERNPGKPVRATFYLLVKIEIPDRAPFAQAANRAPRHPIVLASKYVSDGYFSYALRTFP